MKPLGNNQPMVEHPAYGDYARSLVDRPTYYGEVQSFIATDVPIENLANVQPHMDRGDELAV